MKSVLLRIKENNGIILYERPDFRKFPPLTKYFIIYDLERYPSSKYYGEFRTYQKAKSEFNRLTKT